MIGNIEFAPLLPLQKSSRPRMPPAVAASTKAVAFAVATALGAVAIHRLGYVDDRLAWTFSSRSTKGQSEMATTSASATAQRMPKLVAFDLDYTLWPLWVDTHVTPPLRRPSPSVKSAPPPLNLVKDRFGTSLSFYRDVPSILGRLKTTQAEGEEGIKIAACSRTHAPDAARQALEQLLVAAPSSAATKTAMGRQESGQATVKAIELFDELEIYPGSKIVHFEALHRRTGIPYSEMLFFDDERRNSEVERKLGVKFCLVPDGLDEQVFEKGLAEWRKARGSKS